MKVQIIDKNGSVVWVHDVAAPLDRSGDAWRDGNHELMAGVCYSLRRAVEQAEFSPEEKEWMWPFSISSSSEWTFQKVAQRVALEEPLKAGCEPRPWHCQHHNNSTDQSCEKLSHKIVFVVLQ